MAMNVCPTWSFCQVARSWVTSERASWRTCSRPARPSAVAAGCAETCAAAACRACAARYDFLHDTTETTSQTLAIWAWQAPVLAHDTCACSAAARQVIWQFTVILSVVRGAQGCALTSAASQIMQRDANATINQYGNSHVPTLHVTFVSTTALENCKNGIQHSKLTKGRGSTHRETASNGSAREQTPSYCSTALIAALSASSFLRAAFIGRLPVWHRAQHTMRVLYD